MVRKTVRARARADVASVYTVGIDGWDGMDGRDRFSGGGGGVEARRIDPSAARAVHRSIVARLLACLCTPSVVRDHPSAA